jgi:hypothetical protein
MRNNSNTLFSDEFKEALSNISVNRKDKLILRLLKKDLDLANQLHFELLDDGNIDEKRNKIAAHIKDRIARTYLNASNLGWILSDIRYLSGDISYYVKITKDKYGDPYLNLFLLIEVLKKFNPIIPKGAPKKKAKFCLYIINKAFKMVLQIHRMHDDLRFDLREDLSTLSSLFAQNDPLMKTCIHHGFDPNWFDPDLIPEDIVAYHKELKNNGYLK